MTGGPGADPVAISTPLSKMFEIPLLKTDCSPEVTIASPAPAPAKNKDLGTFEPRARSELHDWAESLAAPPLATAQAITKNKTALLGIKIEPDRTTKFGCSP